MLFWLQDRGDRVNQKMIKNIISASLLLYLSACASLPSVERELVRDSKIDVIHIVTSQDKLIPDIAQGGSQSALGAIVKSIADNSRINKTDALNENLGGYDFRDDLVEQVKQSFGLEDVQLLKVGSANDNLAVEKGVPQLRLSYRVSSSYTYLHVSAVLRYLMEGQARNYSKVYISRLDLESFGVPEKKKYKYLLENSSVLREALKESARNIAIMAHADLRGSVINSAPIETITVPVTNGGKWGKKVTMPIANETKKQLYLIDTDSYLSHMIVSPSIALKRKKIKQ